MVGASWHFQQTGQLKIVPTAAIYPLLPLVAHHPPSLRAQVLAAQAHSRTCFGYEPYGPWLPECAYAPGIEETLLQAGVRWFIVDAHGLLHAQPQPRYGTYAPVFTPNGLGVFGRDAEFAKQVWSWQEGHRRDSGGSGISAATSAAMPNSTSPALPARTASAGPHGFQVLPDHPCYL